MLIQHSTGAFYFFNEVRLMVNSTVRHGLRTRCNVKWAELIRTGGETCIRLNLVVLSCEITR